MGGIRDLLRTLAHPTEVDLQRLVKELKGGAGSPSELIDLKTLLDSPELTTLLAPETRAELLRFIGGRASPDGVFAVAELISGLAELQSAESVPDKLSADLQLMKDALLDPKLKPEQRQSRVLEFVMPYVRKLVELSESGADGLPKETPGAQKESAPIDRNVEPSDTNDGQDTTKPTGDSKTRVPAKAALADAKTVKEDAPLSQVKMGRQEGSELATSKKKVANARAADAKTEVKSDLAREASSEPVSPRFDRAARGGIFETRELPPTQPTRSAISPEAREQQATRMGEVIRSSGLDSVVQSAAAPRTLSALTTELTLSKSVVELQVRVETLALPKPQPQAPTPSRRAAESRRVSLGRDPRGTQRRLGGNMLWNVLHRIRGEPENESEANDAWDRQVVIALLVLLGIAIMITALLAI
ncbi:MAG: hypothetical protein ACT4TC_13815 [Myxococcaceae bacterium]